MNMIEAAAAINAAADILCADNNRAELIDFYRHEIARLRMEGEKTQPGTDRLIANVRIGNAEFALLRLQREQRDMVNG